jgi:serine/threonine-protein kinase
VESCGPFTLVQKVAEGDAAQVWRAVKVADGPRGPHYAVKQIAPALELEAGFVSALMTAASSAAILRHARIVRTWEAGQHPGRTNLDATRHYVALDFVVGAPLNAVLNQVRSTGGDIPRPLAFYAMRAVAEALQAAHSATSPSGTPLALNHGDVAPCNVLVDMDGDVKVTDFCIARARAKILNPKDLALKYRYHYMAPETARVGITDARSDLYSVGIMLHELMAQRRLRRGHTPEELLSLAKAGTWPTLQSLGVPTDPALDAMLHRLLHDDPAQRTPSADELLAEMNAYVRTKDLGMEQGQVADLMAQHFSSLLQREDEARPLLQQVFVRTGSSVSLAPVTAAPLPPVMAPSPEALEIDRPAPAERAHPPAAQRAVPQRTRPVPRRPYRTRSSTTVAVVLGTLLAVAGSGVFGVSWWLKERRPRRERSELAPKDLSRIVGGRTALFWSERVATLDDAIAKAQEETGDPSHPRVNWLRNLREDTLRKARALGLDDIESISRSER